MTLNRNQLLAKEKVKIERVNLADGEFIFVRQMSGRTRDHFEQSLLKQVKNAKGQIETFEQTLEDFRAKLVVATACNEEGEPLLLPEDVATLSKNMSAVTLDKIVAKAQEINKITEEDKEAMVKNSEAVQDGNSTSDSVEN
jgi:hypothetical protein